MVASAKAIEAPTIEPRGASQMDSCIDPAASVQPAGSQLRINADVVGHADRRVARRRQRLVERT
jgi:hypothetical protein